MYMQATIEVASEHAAEFEAALKEIVAVQAGHGWKLVAAFMQITGVLGTYVDVWEIEDSGVFQRGLVALRGHPDYPRFKAVLSKAVKRETVVLGVPASYAGQ